jgi:uncharacterized protein YkwD
LSIIISLIITLVSVASEPFDEITTAEPVCSSTECSVSSSGNVHSKDAVELFQLCNRAREDAGLDKLVHSCEISQLTYIRACEQLSAQGHLRPDSSRFYTVFEENGMVYDAYGENIVIIRSQKNFSPSYALSLWLSSETHKKILLGKWTYSGICVLESDEGYFYAVQLFAR